MQQETLMTNEHETLMTNEHFLKLNKSLGLSSDQVFEATVTSTTTYIYTLTQSTLMFSICTVMEEIRMHTLNITYAPNNKVATFIDQRV